MKKWLFTDFDGTLRNGSDGFIDPRDEQFVKDFQAKGNKLVIATGRSVDMVQKDLDRVNIKPDMYVANAGTLIFNIHGDLLYSKRIPEKYNKLLADYLESMNMKKLIFVTKESEYYLFADKPSKHYDGTLKRPVLNKPFSYLWDKEIMCFKVQTSREKLDKLIKFLNEKAPELTIINNFDSDLVEIHPPKSSKGHAIKIVQAMFHVRENQILTVGDDSNDITMLDWFANSYVIKQPYNKEILKYGKHEIDMLFEMKNLIK